MIRLVSVLLLSFALLSASDKLAVSDDVIYDQVRVKLAGDRDTGGDNIQVKVTKGVVELSGTVRKPTAKTKAEKLTKKVKGVNKVVNQLKVSNG